MYSRTGGEARGRSSSRSTSPTSGTDGGVSLVQSAHGRPCARGAVFALGETALGVRESDRRLLTDRREIGYRSLVLARGRKGFGFLQALMDSLAVPYVDNVVDIGLRLEMHEQNYPIVPDFYDPKFLFPQKVRTFCTNSGKATSVKEKYDGRGGRDYFSVNGHAFSQRGEASGLVNFALLKTVRFTRAPCQRAGVRPDARPAGHAHGRRPAAHAAGR